MVVGHGIEVVEVRSIERLLGSPDAEEFFTAAEREQADPPTAAHFAGLLAAKRAVVKALRRTFTHVTWTEIEIWWVGHPAAEVRLRGQALWSADRLGIGPWYLSVADFGGYVMASVIAVKD